MTFPRSISNLRLLAFGLAATLSGGGPARAQDAPVDEAPSKSLSLSQQTLTHARDWLIQEGPRLAFQIGVAFVVFLLFALLAKIVGRLTRKALDSERAQFSQLLEDFIVSFVVKAIIVFGLLVSLSQMGIELGPLLAGVGVAGFILGFAVQDSLSNFAAGLMLLAYRPYDVGHSIEAAGVLGKVSNMSLVSTTIVTFDNQRLVVPNSKIWGGVIRNISAEPTRRVDMVFGIGYNDDIDQAEAVLRDIVTSHELVLEDPEPVIQLDALADSSVNFVVRPWTLNGDWATVRWDVTREVKRRFDAEGISIPFPQRDVHMHQSESAGKR